MDAANAGTLAEFASLRDEISRRMELRHSTLLATFTAAGILLGVGLSEERVALVYPPVALFLSLVWAQHDVRITAIGQYIRLRVEPKVPGLQWESTRVDVKRAHRLPGTAASAAGIFLGTQGLALVAAFGGVSSFGWAEWVFVAAAAVAVLLTARTLLTAHRVNTELREVVPPSGPPSGTSAD